MKDKQCRSGKNLAQASTGFEVSRQFGLLPNCHRCTALTCTKLPAMVNGNPRLVNHKRVYRVMRDNNLLLFRHG